MTLVSNQWLPLGWMITQLTLVTIWMGDCFVLIWLNHHYAAPLDQGITFTTLLKLFSFTLHTSNIGFKGDY